MRAAAYLLIALGLTVMVASMVLDEWRPSGAPRPPRAGQLVRHNPTPRLPAWQIASAGGALVVVGFLLACRAESARRH